jgi:hypothetical protein
MSNKHAFIFAMSQIRVAPTPTAVDVQNASTYALACLAKERYDNDKYVAFSSKTQLRWAQNGTRQTPARHTYFWPQALCDTRHAGVCPDGQVELMGEQVCKSVSCFSYTASGKPVHPGLSDNAYCYDKLGKWTTKLKGKFVPAPDPLNVVVAPDMPYLEWNKRLSMCEIASPRMREWTTMPHLRVPVMSADEKRVESYKSVTGLSSPDVPPFVYEEGDGGTVDMTREYCNRMGVSFDEKAKDCYIEQWQKVLEDWFVGKTIVRAFK